MKKEDFDGILKNVFNADMHKDATVEGEEFVKYFSFEDAKKEVFLGGTCNDSKWRETFIKLIDKVKFFNPVVEDWNEEAQAAEEAAKERCGIHLYVITPKMLGVFSIAEVVKSAIINPKGTYFAIIEEDGKDKFTASQLKSFEATVGLVLDFCDNCYFLSNFKALETVAKDIVDSKRGYANTMIVNLQSHPYKIAGKLGIQVYDEINISKEAIKFYNDKFPDANNMETIRHLNKAKQAQEARTASRKARNVEGKNAK